MSKHTHLHANEARMNLTWMGLNGDLVEPVPFHVHDAELLRIAERALRAGAVSGISKRRKASLAGFVVDRFPATGGVTHNRVFIRPSTPFG